MLLLFQTPSSYITRTRGHRQILTHAFWLCTQLPSNQYTYELRFILKIIVVAIYSLSHVWLFETPWTCSPPGSSIHGISLAKILDWIAISFSRGSSRPRDWTQVSWKKQPATTEIFKFRCELWRGIQDATCFSDDFSCPSFSVGMVSMFWLIVEENNTTIKTPGEELLWRLSSKQSTCQCRRTGARPLVQEDPTCCRTTKPQLLSLCSIAHELQQLEPMCPRAHSLQREATAVRSPNTALQSNLCLLQPEKNPCKQQRPTAQPEITKQTNKQKTPQL